MPGQWATNPASSLNSPLVETTIAANRVSYRERLRAGQESSQRLHPYLQAKLLEIPEESVAAFDAATTGLRQQLNRAGWHGQQYLQMPYDFTAGRVFPSSPRRGARLHVDALLRVAASLPIAIVHSLRPGEARDDAIRRLQSYAHRLAVPFAYLLDENGTVLEFYWSTSQDLAHLQVSTLSAFPEREALWQRWAGALRLTDQKHKRVLYFPYRRTDKTLRYY